MIVGNRAGGEFAGVRTARKHIGWAVRALPGGEEFRAHMNTLGSIDSQIQAVTHFFDELSLHHDRLPDAVPAIDEEDDAHEDRAASCAAN